ncbi:hypothetical protein GQ600_1493 [Phytophthora cactorum]|nr:hypothetical protein GQ600_1493 [Phytophthora cactorum]
MALFSADCLFSAAILRQLACPRQQETRWKQSKQRSKGTIAVIVLAMVSVEIKMPRSRRARWHNDGPDDSVSSLRVLLDWLTTEGNYNKWRGGDKQSGETKAVLAAQISTLIHEKGITHLRKPKDTITKISQLEQSFRDAVDFLIIPVLASRTSPRCNKRSRKGARTTAS